MDTGTRTTMTDDQIDAWAAALEGRSPADVLAWAADRFAPRLVFATGFGAEGCVLVHLVAEHDLPVDLVTLDTGLLFPETRALWARLECRYGVRIRGVEPAISLASQAGAFGDALWAREPDRCCAIRKVAPLEATLSAADAWISAIRRDQTPDRASAAVIERDARRGLVKVNPLAAWSAADVWSFIRAHGVPYNPLHDHGYPSIGCWPCTTAVAEGEDPRAGRWRGREKTECGLHAGTNAADTTPSRHRRRFLPVFAEPGPSTHQGA
jgi:phosphoadenosine phosphosulfate reductase